MSDSIPKINHIDPNQGSMAAKANGNFDAASMAMWFAYNEPGSAGLNFALLGADPYIDGVRTDIDGQTVALSNNTTNYVQINRAGVMSTVTGIWDADKLPLYKVVTASGFVTSYEDHRDARLMERFFSAHAVQSMTAGGEGNKTLTVHQALCGSLEATGALTALRDAILPAIRREWTVFSNTTGGHGVRWKTASGSGITVADTKRAVVQCDGTNVVRVTPDT